MKIMVSAVMLALILLSLFMLAFNVYPVNADFAGTVYIRADGNVDPSGAPVQRVGNVYTLTGNITTTADGIIVERDSIILDGAGFTVQGNGRDVGVYLYGRTNVTIRNMQVKNFYSGIALGSSGNSSLIGNTITNSVYGFWLYKSGNSSLSGNTITNNAAGMYLYSSGNSSLSGNTITNNLDGIYLDFSGNTTLIGNLFFNDGLAVYESYGNVVADNLVNGKPLVYLENVSGRVVDEAGQVILVNCNNITIQNLNLSYTDSAIRLWRTNNTRINGNNIANNYYGIMLYSSSGNWIFHNNFVDNGLQVYSASPVNVWDDGREGNFWSNYNGTDANSNGIGDTPYVIDANNTDRYPLMGPFKKFNAGVWNNTAYNVEVVSNSTVSGFQFNPAEGALLRFNVTGADGTKGFCRVAIPKGLLNAEAGQWIVLVDNQPVSYNITSDENYTYITFTYTHSTKTVTIQGTQVIPEFPTATFMLLFMALSTITIILAKKKPLKTKTKP